MLCTNNPISPQSVDISSIWFSIKKKEIWEWCDVFPCANWN
jgi:hypothetical protein